MTDLIRYRNFILDSYADRLRRTQGAPRMHSTSLGLPIMAVTPERRVLNVVRPTPHNFGYTGTGGLAVVASYDTEAHGRLLHVSVSLRERVPTWNEMTDVWLAFSTDQPMMVLPQAAHHVNNHANCLHFFSVPRQWISTVREAQDQAIHLDTKGAYRPRRDEPTRLTFGAVRPPYAIVADYRQSVFATDRDAMTWYTMPGQRPADPQGLYLDYTPEPWRGGFAVGLPELGRLA